MEKIKIENWNGYSIRFVLKDEDWWAVAKDVADALGYDKPSNMIRQVDPSEKGVHKVSTLGGEQEMSVITELGIYDCIFGSHRPEAKAFKQWVYSVIKELRKSSGYEGFEVFCMLDKEHQKKAMEQLKNSLVSPTKIDYIKANTIADKAVSNRHGHPKMVKKTNMTPEMLRDREKVLEDVVNLMDLKERYHMDLSVSQTIYGAQHTNNPN